jgi:hypothetical protein
MRDLGDYGLRGLGIREYVGGKVFVKQYHFWVGSRRFDVG